MSLSSSVVKRQEHNLQGSFSGNERALISYFSSLLAAIYFQVSHHLIVPSVDLGTHSSLLD